MNKRMKVLHVEDDHYDALLLADLLDQAGHKEILLTRADTLFKAKALLKDQDFDVVLLDLVLPDERGINTLLSVRCSAPLLPVVVLTSLSDFGTATEAVASGAEDYSVKGRDSAQELARKLYCAIERHRNRLIMHARMAEAGLENAELARQLRELRQSPEQPHAPAA